MTRLERAGSRLLRARTRFAQTARACVDGIPAALVVGLAFAFVFFVDPSTSPLAPPCLFLALFGVRCPGCGALRALHALAHGELERALALNAPFVYALPVTAAVASLRRLRSARTVTRVEASSSSGNTNSSSS